MGLLCYNIPMNSISVVIPCYNEEESIGQVVESVLRENVLEVVVVDNNSTDGSGAAAERAGGRVVKETTQGYGAALKAGFRAARGDIIVTLDADGQYPAEKIAALAKLLDEEHLDFISGNRLPFTKGSESFVRTFGNKFLTFAANAVFGISLKDSQSGMWVFRRSALEKIFPESDDMPLSEEIKIRAILHPEVSFKEFYIPYRPRVGESKLSPLKHGFKNLFYLFSLKKRISHGKKA